MGSQFGVNLQSTNIKAVTDEWKQFYEENIKGWEESKKATQESGKEDSLDQNQNSEKEEAEGQRMAAKEFDDVNPKTMNIALVLKMFQQLRQVLSNKTCDNAEKRVFELETWQKFQLQKMESLQEDLSQSQAVSKMLSGTVVRMSGMLVTLEKRIEQLEMNNNKMSIVISGVEVDKEKAVAIEKVETFIEDLLEVQIRVSDLFFLGEATPRAIVATLQTVQQKRLVMQNVAKLAGYENTEGKPFFINEFSTVVENERKRREKAIFRQNAREQEIN